MDIKKIRAVVGEEFRVQDRRGNVQVDIEDLRGLDFFEKAEKFKIARDKLEAAGFPHLVMQEGYKGKTGEWVSWPSLWVNATGQVDSTALTSVVKELGVALAALRAAGLIPATETKTEDTSEDEKVAF